MNYPRPITSIHQVEITSHCNLRCSYCPSRHLDVPKAEGGFGRAKENMDLFTFGRALRWAQHFAEQGTQGELSLTGIGETLLHPEWREFCRLAREALPDPERNPILFSTNGLLLDDDACAYLAELRIGVFVSLHRPEKAGPALNAAQRHGILIGVNHAAATSSFDWAGALDVEVTAPPIPCEYLRTGWAVVLADGRVTTCCLDATGDGVVGHVDDEIGSLSIAPWAGEGPNGREIGCSQCFMTVP